MEIRIQIPTRAQVVNGGTVVQVAPEKESWAKEQLGDFAGRSGVYLHHARGSILYVGKTTEGNWGTFGERLRREFQYSSSQASDLHKLLAERQPIRTYFLELDDIDMMVDAGPMQLTRERKALIMEQVLIGLFLPPGNKV